MKRKPYPKYKDSGVEWLGQVPEHWIQTKLRWFLSARSGDFVSADDFESIMTEDFSTAVIGGNGVMGYTRTANSVSKTLIVGRVGALCGNVHLFEEPVWVTDNALKIGYQDTEFNVQYLFWLLKSLRLNDYANKNAQPLITGETIKMMEAIIPPIPEQSAIAAFLDQKTAQIDALIQKKKELIAKLGEQRIALITQAVTKGLNPKVKLKDSGVEWLGQVPVHWEVMKLHHVVRMKSGETITSMEIEKEGTYPVYGGNGLRGYYESFTHDGEYVLIGRQGALCGNINYAKGKFWASEHAVVATPDRRLNTIWLGETLRVMNLNQYSVSAAQPGISVEEIGRLRLPFPPLTEQSTIATFLDQKTAQIDALVRKTEEAVAKLEEYRMAVINAAVTGKVDVGG